MIDKVIDDLNVKLNENINRDSIVYYNDGHTKSLVFGINKYIIKIFRRKSLENQLIFYKEYKDFKYFPKIITYNKELIIERRNEILQELDNHEAHSKEEIENYEKELNEIILTLAKLK